jgi:hypothetical protein
MFEIHFVYQSGGPERYISWTAARAGGHGEVTSRGHWVLRAEVAEWPIALGTRLDGDVTVTFTGRHLTLEAKTLNRLEEYWNELAGKVQRREFDSR